MQFGDLTLKHCRHGWMLYDVARIYVGRCLDLYGQYSEGEVRLMRTFLRLGKSAIDVGANIGALTMPMSQIVGDRGLVYAIEADRDTFNVLCGNLALNGIRNVRPLNALVTAREPAISERADTALPDRSACSVPLDSLALERCDFVKVDVDGGELDVLRSGEMQIERFRPVLYFENELRERSSALLEFVMRTLGYDAYFHPTPLFEPDNFFGNPVNHWAPTEFVSMMVLAIPGERKLDVGLRRITSADDWWDFGIPISGYFTG
jgi:FkbM family methyltransferase